jgi:hypothetical protein
MAFITTVEYYSPSPFLIIYYLTFSVEGLQSIGQGFVQGQLTAPFARTRRRSRNARRNKRGHSVKGMSAFSDRHYSTVMQPAGLRGSGLYAYAPLRINWE